MPVEQNVPRVLFDGQHLQLLHVARGGSLRLLTFDIMHARANGRNAFAKSLCERLGYDLLAIVPKHPCWYPAAEMQRIVPICLALGGPLTVAYGASMGGYGALRWGRALGADHALACSPQDSIDPTVTGAHDQRYARHFRADLHRGMEVDAENLPANSIVLHDPHFRQDRFHADRLKAAGAKLLALPHMGHRTVETVAGSAHAERVFQDLLAGDLSSLRRRLLARRKENQSYRLHLASHAIQRGRHATAERVVSTVTDPWSYHRLMARLAAARQDAATEALHYQQALAAKPGCKLTRLRLERLGQDVTLSFAKVIQA